MRVLVACECSGVVRRAFRARGHDAWSCDILPVTDDAAEHYHCDVREILGMRWDLMIAHPPCTYLCNASVGRLIKTPRNPSPGVLYGEERWVAMREGAEFFKTLLNCDIPRVAVENPTMHGYALDIIGRGYSQKIQPYDFGDDASKGTGLWLKNLPKLALDPAKRKAGRWVMHNGKMVERWGNQTDSGQNNVTPSDLRGHLRSITYDGIAEAFAEQWGSLSIEAAISQPFALVA